MEVSVVSVSVSVCVLSLRLQVTKKEPQKLAASLPVQLQKHRKNAVGGRGREREGRRSRRNCERRSRQTELNSTIAMFMLWLKEGGRAREGKGRRGERLQPGLTGGWQRNQREFVLQWAERYEKKKS